MGWLHRWEEHQRLYLPGRAAAVEAMLDVIEAAARPRPDRPLRLLDLAGGPGPFTAAAARRFPHAEITLLDVDPILLALADTTMAALGLEDRVKIAVADLSTPAWVGEIEGPFDAAVAVLALHYFEPGRLRRLYAEIRTLLGPSGLLLNTDCVPDPGAPSMTGALDQHLASGRHQAIASGAEDWADWWRSVRLDPAVADLVPVGGAGDSAIATSAEVHPDLDWHLEVLQAAGFAEAGLTWRYLTSATICAR